MRAISCSMSTIAGTATGRSRSCRRRRERFIAKRVDGMAERWFQQGKSRRDLTLLRRVVDQAFCSSWGDDALELLGDLAFQDGRFGEARAAYGRIVADHPEDPFTLVHPDPSVDLARVAAKKLLCRAAAGENPPGPADLNELRRALSRRDRRLAGPNRAYAEIVAAGAWTRTGCGPAREPDNRWPTFAGSFQRTQARPGADRRGLDAVASRSREGVVSSRRRGSTPRTGIGGGPVTAAAGAAAGVSSDRAGRPGDRLRWLLGCWLST